MSHTDMTVVDFNAKLYEDFPTFFNDNFWGVECSPGWFSIIYSMCEKLSKLESLPETFYITQIKEKFGTLNVYRVNEPIQARGIIMDAENLSATTCEKCGVPNAGHTSINGWLRTLCEPCHKCLLEGKKVSFAPSVG